MRLAARATVLATTLSAGLISGCAHRQPAWNPPTPPSASNETVFYATDRQPVLVQKQCKPGEELSTQPMYGAGSAGKLIYGEYAMRLPWTARIGDLVSYQPRGECLRTPSNAVFLTGPVQQDREKFFREVREEAGRSPRKEVLVFVHGYNFTFDEAALWAAQLRRYLGYAGPIVAYSWPSRGELTGYGDDDKSVATTTEHLSQFLIELEKEVPGAAVDVLAHSMGSRPTAAALSELAGRGEVRFRNVIFAAPDVEKKKFEAEVRSATKLAKRVTVYVCSSDQALLASEKYHGDLRAGRELVLIPGVDTVDVTAVDKTRFHHTYYLENRFVLGDMYQLLRGETPPAERFGMIEIEVQAGKYWQIRP